MHKGWGLYIEKLVNKKAIRHENRELHWFLYNPKYQEFAENSKGPLEFQLLCIYVLKSRESKTD